MVLLLVSDSHLSLPLNLSKSFMLEFLPSKITLEVIYSITEQVFSWIQLPSISCGNVSDSGFIYPWMQLLSMQFSCRHMSEGCRAHTSVRSDWIMACCWLVMVRLDMLLSGWRRNRIGLSRTLGERVGEKMDSTKSVGAAIFVGWIRWFQLLQLSAAQSRRCIALRNLHLSSMYIKKEVPSSAYVYHLGTSSFIIYLHNQNVFYV